MLIPSIDLQGGRIVQLVQGERLVVESDDIAGWIERFRGFRKIQLIDLDAARGEGANRELVQRICRELPCRVGGGIRSIEAAQEALAVGATHVILGSALFSKGRVDLDFGKQFADALGPDRLVAAVDGRGGRVVVNGWRTTLDIAPVEAVRTLDTYVSEFLYTDVDREGLMSGTDMDAIVAIRNVTARRVSAAGGINTVEEVARLDALGVDALVGRALYKGRLKVNRAGLEAE